MEKLEEMWGHMNLTKEEDAAIDIGREDVQRKGDLRLIRKTCIER